MPNVANVGVDSTNAVIRPGAAHPGEGSEMAATNLRNPTTWPEGFVPVSVDTLRRGSEVDFNLHVQRGGQMAHYRNRGMVFTDHEAESLSANGIDVLWVQEEGASGYGRYLEGQLHAMMGDAEVETEAKAHALYASSRSVTLEILATPSRENMDRAQDVVQHTVGQVLGDPRSLAAMIATLSTQYQLQTHSVNVSVYSVALARQIGRTDGQELTEYGLGGLLHDLGKSLIDASILNKPSRLTAAEWEIMTGHPEGGLRTAGGLRRGPHDYGAGGNGSSRAYERHGLSAWTAWRGDSASRESGVDCGQLRRADHQTSLQRCRSRVRRAGDHAR